MIHKILVGLAGTEYTEVAIHRAIELALRHSAALTGVTVVNQARLMPRQSVPIGAGSLAVQLREERAELTRLRVEAATRKFETACKNAGVSYRLEKETGDAFELILSRSRYHDLTIFGLRSVFEYCFNDLDSSELLDKLVRSGMRPIIAVSKKFRPIHRVLVAYSGSIESANAMRRFMQLRLWPNTRLKIVSLDDAQEPPAKLLEEASDYCGAHGFDVEAEHLNGPAGPALLAHAEDWDADLIVMGTSAQPVMLKRLFGNTALHVMQNVKRPLFLAQ